MDIHYFAYGSCMDEEDFRRTVPVFERLGPATLRGYRLAFTYFSPKRNAGAADIVPDAAQSVCGVLYRFDESLLPRLDEREGVQNRAYERFIVPVEHRGRPVDAFTYQVVHKHLDEVAPSDHYLRLIFNGLACHADTAYADALRRRVKQKFNLECP